MTRPRILFRYTGRAYLPEIAAYRRYLDGRHPSVVHSDTLESPDLHETEADIVWRFSDFHRPCAADAVVNEYNSLSMDPLGRWKNTAKRLSERRPWRRVFLNQTVRRHYGFSDRVQSRVRDMGIDPSFFRVRQQKCFDYVYVGAIDRRRRLTPALDAFVGPLRRHSLLVIGKAPADVRERYGRYGNIKFAGAVPHYEVAELAAQARFGLNLVPDRYPYNVQTSTKLLEYCALGLGVISTRYPWVERFASERRARFFWTRGDLGELAAPGSGEPETCVPQVEDLLWDHVIEKSSVFDFLNGQGSDGPGGAP